MVKELTEHMARMRNGSEACWESATSTKVTISPITSVIAKGKGRNRISLPEKVRKRSHDAETVKNSTTGKEIPNVSTTS